jgi:competence protein ComEC
MKRPFAHIGFSCAVTLLFINVFGCEIVIPAMAGLGVLLAISLVIKRYRQAVAVPLTFASALFACLVFLSIHYAVYQPAQLLDGASANSTFYITDTVINNGSNYVCNAKTCFIGIDGAPQEIKIRLLSDTRLTATPYQLVKGVLDFTSVKEKDYGQYSLLANGIYASAKVKAYEATQEYISSPLSYILAFREQLINQVYYALGGGDEGALAVARLTGSKQYLSEETYQAFLFSGESHIMAISGLHLSVISGFIFALLRRFHINRKVSVAAVILIALAFMAMVGFTKSVVRAGIMVIVILSAELINRKGDTLNSLGVAVFIICLNPYAVCDAGAVLSVLCVLGLSTLYPRLRFYDKKKHGKRFNMLMTPILYLGDRGLAGLSVILYTMPAVYIFFGNINLLTVFANLIIIPLAGVSTVMSLITFFFNFNEIRPSIITDLHFYLNALIIRLTKAFSAVTVGVMNMGTIFAFTFASILFIVSLCFFFRNKRLKDIVTVLSSMMLIGICAFSVIYSLNTASVFICENSGVIISDKDCAIAIGIDNKKDYYEAQSFLQGRRKRLDTVITINNSEYSQRLVEVFGAKQIITPKAGFKTDADVNVCTSYEDEISDKIKLKYFANDEFDYVSVLVYNTQVTKGNNISQCGDIFIRNNHIYDKDGITVTENGGTLYTVGKNSFTKEQYNG